MQDQSSVLRADLAAAIMCGIAVAFNWPQAAEAVRAAIAAMRHRGDVTDALATPAPGSAFCTRRLRIVDAEHNQQPALSSAAVSCCLSTVKSTTTACCAPSLGLAASRSVREVTPSLASALSVWCDQALQRLSGMYAFVALDPRSGEFLAVRNPLGIKPLHVLQLGSGWLFASEIAPLLQASEQGDVVMAPPGTFLIRGRMGRHYALPSRSEGPPPTAV